MTDTSIKTSRAKRCGGSNWLYHLYSGNFVCAFILFAFAMGVLFFAIPYGVDEGYENVILTPATVPKILAILLAILAVAQGIKSFFSPLAHTPKSHTPNPKKGTYSSLETGGNVKRELGLFILVSAYVYALPNLGFILTSALLGAILLWLSFERSVVRYLLGIVGVPVLIWFIAVPLLERPLPSGTLFTHFLL